MTRRTFFDGSYLGNVDHLVKKIEIQNFSKSSTITAEINDIAIQFHEYKSSISLISDELKELFGLKKIGKNSCFLANKKSILVRLHGKKKRLSSYEGEITASMKEEIQRLFIFRWCLGLKNNDERALFVIETSLDSFVTSVKDNKIDYSTSWIPDTVIKKWFDNDREKINSFLENRFENIIPFNLRSKIETVIRRIDPEQIQWTHFIVPRVYSFR